uniref:Uncharacterized protein n=1 Tax=Candidozyma auris TaxID=498019 RepID=A0A0L0P556_CANAR
MRGRDTDRLGLAGGDGHWLSVSLAAQDNVWGADKVEERQTKKRDKREDLDEDNANIRKR